MDQEFEENDEEKHEVTANIQKRHEQLLQLMTNLSTDMRSIADRVQKIEGRERGDTEAKIKKRIKKEGLKRQRTEDQRLAQTLPVQMGLNNLDYVGTRFGIDNVGRFMDFINRSFPFMNISTDQETMNTALMSPRVTAYLKKGDIVYGLTADNQILINYKVFTRYSSRC